MPGSVASATLLRSDVPAANLVGITEAVHDIVAGLLVAGAGVTLTYNDTANTLTVTATGGTTDPEVVRDSIAAALVAGSGVTITANDAADTITISATGASTASAITYTPAGNLSATTVQAAINELDTEKVPVASLVTIPTVIILAGNAPTAAEGDNGDLGRATDGTFWGPKASGAWPNAPRVGDTVYAYAFHEAATIRTAAATLTAGSTRSNLCSASGGAFTVTLPASPITGYEYEIVKTDSSANAVTVAPTTGTINGAATYVLTAQNKYVSVKYVSNNSWVIVGSN